MSSTSQNTPPTPSIMDARKFLRAINSSAQSKVVFFENAIKKLGQEAGKQYRMVALDSSSLIFEDVGSNLYYSADIARKQRGMEISNIKEVRIVDEQKQESFDGHCTAFVESLARNDFKEAEKIFKAIESQRFRPSVIPESGWVTTKDGMARHISVDEEKSSYDIPAITEAFCEAVSDHIEISEDGRVVRGEFPETGEKFDIPVNEMTRRKLVANYMKTFAESAWKSESFQRLIKNVSGMISNGEIKEAVQVAAKFLKENQEFTMLTSSESNLLVENALAADGEFNSILAEDAATLVHKTNIKVNKGAIIDAWQKTAVKAENAELLHTMKLLESSQNFSEEYDTFLGTVFNEGVAVQTARAKAYLTTLKVINSILTKMEGKEDLAKQVESMVAELEEPEPGTDIIMEAEQLLCSIPDTLINRIVNLENFSEIPGDEKPIDEEAPAEPEGPAVPLPGGSLPKGEGEEEEGEEEAPAGPPPLPLPESVDKASMENMTLVEDMNIVQLKNELDHWKTDGHIYLTEDGFEDCNSQFTRYIKRCEELGAADLSKEFEVLRDNMIKTGDDVVSEDEIVEDPYASSDLGTETAIDEEYGAKKGKGKAASGDPKMGAPTGKGVAEKSGSEPKYAGKGKAASGDPKMGAPTGKGLADKKASDADFSGSGKTEGAGKAGGKGLTGKSVKQTPDLKPNKGTDLEKPKTGKAEMGRPEGKGVAESVGNPEKVAPITSAGQNPGAGTSTKTTKQYSGSWLDKLDEKLTSDLPKSDDNTNKVKHKAQKGGVAEALKILKPYIAEGSEVTNELVDGAIAKLKEAARTDESLKSKVEMVEAVRRPWFDRFGESQPERMAGDLQSNRALVNVKCDNPDCPSRMAGPLASPNRGITGEPCSKCDVGTLMSLTPEPTDEITTGACVCNTCGEETSSGTPGEPCEMCGRGYLEYAGDIPQSSVARQDQIKAEPSAPSTPPIPGIEEAQYKGPTKGIKPIGFKKSSLAEKETKGKGKLAEDVAAIVISNADKIDDIIASVVNSMDKEGLSDLTTEPLMTSPPEPITPETPEIPETTPETPETPEMPEVPETPGETEETPEETPETPEVPETETEKPEEKEEETEEEK